MKKIKIYKYGKTTDGKTIYDFKDIPQGYIKIHGLFLDGDEDALKKAKKINPNYDYEIIEELDWAKENADAINRGVMKSKSD